MEEPAAQRGGCSGPAECWVTWQQTCHGHSIGASDRAENHTLRSLPHPEGKCPHTNHPGQSLGHRQSLDHITFLPGSTTPASSSEVIEISTDFMIHPRVVTPTPRLDSFLQLWPCLQTHRDWKNPAEPTVRCPVRRKRITQWDCLGCACVSIYLLGSHGPQTTEPWWPCILVTQMARLGGVRALSRSEKARPDRGWMCSGQSVSVLPKLIFLPVSAFASTHAGDLTC